MTTPLITLDEAKQFIGIRTTNTEHDAVLPALILAATSDIEKATHRTFSAAVLTEFYDTRKTLIDVYDLGGQSESGVVSRATPQSFFLPGYPLSEAAGVEVYYDPKRVFGEDTKLRVQDIFMDWNIGKLTIYKGTYERTNALKVIYEAGFTIGNDNTISASAPADLKSACMFQTAFLFKRRRSENVGHDFDRSVQSENSPSGGAKFNVTQGLCREAQGLVRSYRMPIMGRL